MSTAAQFLPRPAAEHKAERPFGGWPEAAVLALIGQYIAQPFPIGSASRWHRHAGSVAEKRFAEAIAGIVYDAASDDPLARRVAIVAAVRAAGVSAMPLRRLIDVGFEAALAAIEAERQEIVERVATVRQRRTQSALADIAERRKEALAEVRECERVLAAFIRDREWARQKVACGTLNPAALASAERWAERRFLPRLLQRLAAARAAVPTYRQTDGQRRRLAEFSDRLRRLRSAARALRRARRDLGRAKSRPLSRNAA